MRAHEAIAETSVRATVAQFIGRDLGQVSKTTDFFEDLGMDSLAITDHGAMYGVIEFYQAAREAGIKPIIGCEIYIAHGSRLSRNAVDKHNYHLLLLVKNQAGYQNLLQLFSKSHLDGS